jgi:hypothetical protein
MITNSYSKHIAGIIPVGHSGTEFNMPWHDCLMPVHEDYHAIERAVHTAAAASVSTIWVVLHRDAQPIIKKKLGEWLYDPNHVWEGERPFFNKREIPIYYVAIHPKDRRRRDSQAWSALYGAKVASKVSGKVSTWTLPKRFLVVSPYGVSSENTIKENREAIHGKSDALFTYNGKTFLDDEHMPFTFSGENYETCRKAIQLGVWDYERPFSEVFRPMNLEGYNRIELGWHHKITNWQGYSQFLGSPQNSECIRPKYLVQHKWRGLVKDH